MRLAAQAKGGFYPAAPEAVQAAIDRLEPPTEGKFTILDPCAGEGQALKQLSVAFPSATPYAIELDARRAEKVRELFPDTSLAPCSTFGCKVNGFFDVIWLNPPYDGELGGGQRAEHSFLMTVTPWLKPGGVLMFVVPDHLVTRPTPSAQYLYERFDKVCWMPFPASVRKYREIVCFGIRRPLSRESPRSMYSTPLPDVAEPDCSWAITPTKIPVRTFQKVQLTPEELGMAIALSPLQELQRPPKPIELAQPPLPPKKGHTALMLSAGHLDGMVEPENEPPHVIRGVSTKEDYLKEVTESENKDGSSTVKSVYGQKIVLIVRALDGMGNLKNLS